jgi:hypothetical protein
MRKSRGARQKRGASGQTKREADNPLRCPSAPATPGALLVGVVSADGYVLNLGTPLTIDAGFIGAASIHGPPEQRFRFSSPCLKASCARWNGHECGLIGALKESAHKLPETGTKPGDPPLQRCAIRAECRWWRQQGREACKICRLVITDTTYLEDGAGS